MNHKVFLMKSYIVTWQLLQIQDEVTYMWIVTYLKNDYCSHPTLFLVRKYSNMLGGINIWWFFTGFFFTILFQNLMDFNFEENSRQTYHVLNRSTYSVRTTNYEDYDTLSDYDEILQ